MSANPRVCHLGKFYPPALGGMETHVQTLARAQAELGWDVSVVCVNHADRNGRDRTNDPWATTPTLREPDGPVRLTRLGRYGSLAKLDLCPNLPGVLAELRRDPPDVLHLHAPNPLMLLALAVLGQAAPLVVTHQSDIIRQRLLKYALAPFERRVYDRAVRILTSSPLYAAGSSVLRLYGEKIESLPLGLELTSFQQPSCAALAHAARLRSLYGEPLWLTVGRLIYYKGLHIALEALTRVKGTLLVIGTGPLETELRRQADKLGLTDRVVFAGAADATELVGAYHAAAALWFPSNARSEGFGLVQVEAMASGCPVLNTAIPASGVPWVSPHDQTGLTVPVNDALALAAAATRLLSEPGLRARLSAAGRARASLEFDHLTMARRSLAIYRKVLTGTAPAKIDSAETAHAIAASSDNPQPR